MAPISQSPPSSIAARLEDCVFAIKKRITALPTIGMVLGSGMGSFADALEGCIKIPYRELPHMAASSVIGHSGNLCFGSGAGASVLWMQSPGPSYRGAFVGKARQ